MNYRKFAWWNTQWAFAGVRDPSDQRPRRVEPGHDDGTVGVHRRHVAGVGAGQGDPGHPDTVMAASEATLAVLPAGCRLPRRTAVPRPVGARALERLRHRPAAAGRPQGRRGGVPEGDGDGARLRRRLGQRRPRADPGRQHGGRRGRCCARRSRSIRSWPRRTSSWHGAEDARPLRRGARRICGRAAAQYPRDRVVLNQIGRVLFLKRQFAEAVASSGRSWRSIPRICRRTTT